MRPARAAGCFAYTRSVRRTRVGDGLTVRRPWASMLLVSAQIGGKNVENRTDSTDYRGPVLIYGGTRIDQAGIEPVRSWVCARWLFIATSKAGSAPPYLWTSIGPKGAAPVGTTPFNPGQPKYHWVFESPARLAARPWHDNAKGFDGLRPVSWSALVVERPHGTPGDKGCPVHPGEGDEQGCWQQWRTDRDREEQRR